MRPACALVGTAQQLGTDGAGTGMLLFFVVRASDRLTLRTSAASLGVAAPLAMVVLACGVFGSACSYALLYMYYVTKCQMSTRRGGHLLENVKALHAHPFHILLDCRHVAYVSCTVPKQMTERRLPPDDLRSATFTNEDDPPTTLSIRFPSSGDCMTLIVELSGTAPNGAAAAWLSSELDLVLEHVHMYYRLTLNLAELNWCYSENVKALMAFLASLKERNSGLVTTVLIGRAMWQQTSVRAMCAMSGVLCHNGYDDSWNNDFEECQSRG